MTIRVIKHSATLQNLVIFLLLSLFYLHTLESITSGVSAFRIYGFKDFLLRNFILAILTFLISYLVSKAYQISKYAVVIQFFAITYLSSLLYFDSFNKVVLLLYFSYVVFGGYFCLFWFLELSEALYRPNYSPNEIGPVTPYELPCTLHLGNGKTLRGSLTNWDSHSCFIHLDCAAPDKFSDTITLEIIFEGVTFKHQVQACSIYHGGLGVKFLEVNPHQRYNPTWKDLYHITRDRGLEANQPYTGVFL